MATKRTVTSRYRRTSVQKQALKGLLVGFICVASLVIVTMAQITVDQMTVEVYPEQTVASSTLIGP